VESVKCVDIPSMGLPHPPSMYSLLFFPFPNFGEKNFEKENFRMTIQSKFDIGLEQLVKWSQFQASSTAFAISENIVPLMGWHFSE